jgi:xanthine/uracil permease
VSDADSDGIKVCDFAGMWEENKLALPQLTEWGISFSKGKKARTVGVLILSIAALAIEIFIKNRKLAGMFHLFTLLCGVVMGWLVLASMFLPYMSLMYHHLTGSI